MRWTSLAILSLLTAQAALAADLRLKSEAANLPAGVADAVKEGLGKDAFVVRSDANTVLLRLWLRSELPTRATAEQMKNGLTYRELPPTTLLGVIEFPATFVDFRKQEIPAGVYTLRFAIQPDTADHLGVTPHREFLLLTPVAKDRSTDLTEPKSLIAWSSETTGGDHPAVMMLFPSRTSDKDGLLGKGEGIQALRFTRRVSSPGGSGSLGFVLAVSGHVKE